MKTFKAIIFDLDDTLYAERTFVVSGFSAAAAWLSTQAGVRAEQCTAGLTALFEARIRRTTFDMWLNRAGLPPELAAGMVAAYRAHSPTITLYEDVIPAFSRLRDAGLLLGLLTDGYAEVQRRKIAALNIGSWFHAVTVSDELGRDYWKPSRVPYQRTLDLLGVSGSEAVFVGDNPEKDFLGARAAGLKSIRVRRPCCMHSELEPATLEAAANAEVQSLSEIETFFHRL
jgi:putative hydrolase of the HAD superfamily